MFVVWVFFFYTDRLNFLSTHFLIQRCYRGSGGKEEIRNNHQKMALEGLVKSLIFSPAFCPIPTHQHCSLKQGSLCHRERKSVFLAVSICGNSSKKICQSLRVRKSQGYRVSPSQKTVFNNSYLLALVISHSPSMAVRVTS